MSIFPRLVVLLNLCCVTAVLVAVVLHETAAPGARPSTALRVALLQEDLPAVRQAVAAERQRLGDKAGEPEVPEQYREVPASAELLTSAEAQQGFVPHFGTLEKLRWWKVPVDPTALTAPLREPATVIRGSVAAVRAGLDGAERSLQVAEDAAQFLLWAQEQAGSGGFPFPAAIGTSKDRAMQVASRFLQRASSEGRLAEVVRSGWAVNDLGDGGLQFDNGECGVAMFELFELTGAEHYRASGCRAADWAASQPLCINWNYNSFSVWLLSKAFATTGELRYLEAAVQKARLGVIPGQLTEGPHAGRWVDPHNARAVYHFIMMRGLTQLAAVMPADHPHRAEVVGALQLGLRVRNSEILRAGVMNKDHLVEALLLARQVFAGDANFLRETQTVEAWQAVGRLIAAEYRGGRKPLGPCGWGQFCASVVRPISGAAAP